MYSKQYHGNVPAYKLAWWWIKDQQTNWKIKRLIRKLTPAQKHGLLLWAA